MKRVFPPASTERRPRFSGMLLLCLTTVLFLSTPSIGLAVATNSWSSGADGSWAAGGNWSLGVTPGLSTNVLLGGSSTYTASYSNPLSFARIGSLIITNPSATLLINTNGFQSAGANWTAGQIIINAGGLYTNSSSSVSGASNGVLTLNGGTFVNFAGNFGGGTVATTPSLRMNSGEFIGSSGNVYMQVAMTGGVIRVLSGAAKFVGPSIITGGAISNLLAVPISFIAGASATLTNNGQIFTSGFHMDATTISTINFAMDGGLLTITNSFHVGDYLGSVNNKIKTSFLQSAGTVSMTGAEGLILGYSDSGVGNGSTNLYSMSGGTLNVPKITLMGTTATNGANVLNLSGGTINLGSGGLITNTPGGSATYAILLSGGTLGAQQAWSSALNMSLSNSGVGAVTFRASDTNASASDITLSGTLSGSGGVIKTGGGTLWLNGNNSYSGNTSVSNGSLRVNGVSSGTGMLTVYSNASLGGTGSLRSVTLANGGHLSPGNSIGTLTVSNLTLTTGSLFDFELAATNASDKVVDLGTLSLAQLSFSNFSFSTNAGFGAGSYVLVDASAHANSFAAITNESFYGYLGTISLGGTDGNDLVLNVALAIPEPTSIVLLAGSLLVAGFCLYRKKASA